MAVDNNTDKVLNKHKTIGLVYFIKYRLSEYY